MTDVTSINFCKALGLFPLLHKLQFFLPKFPTVDTIFFRTIILYFLLPPMNASISITCSEFCLEFGVFVLLVHSYRKTIKAADRECQRKHFDSINCTLLASLSLPQLHKQPNLSRCLQQFFDVNCFWKM